MLFNVARQTPRLIKDNFPLDFDKEFMKYRGVELQGKTVGIVGLGNIGSAIAKRCTGLGMNLTYWSKSPKDSEYSYKEPTELFANSDVIFPTMALNDETKNLITPKLLKSMKPSAMFISVVHELFDSSLYWIWLMTVNCLGLAMKQVQLRLVRTMAMYGLHLLMHG